MWQTSLGLVSTLLGASSAANVTLMVVGDSWGSLGPSYHELQAMFDRHGVGATVKSVARGGTTAGQWAKEGEKVLIEAAEKLFPELADGPDYMWYSLGGNGA
jgi:hypothetical protein